MARLVSLFVCAVALTVALPARALETIKVLVPDKGNLQYTSFWLADGGGFLKEEGLEIELVVPPGPQQAQSFFEEKKAEIAVLPPPVYASLIAGKVPVVLIANLLANDPIELVVRKKVLEERNLRADMPLKQRLEGLRGVKLGIAPHPPARLRVLYQSVGLDADKDIAQVILHGKEQNEAFEKGEVDALYAHTPYVERAIAHDDAVVFVNQSRGEVPELANRQIHALAMTRTLLDLRPTLAQALVRAVGKAEDLIHQRPAEAVAILARMFPARDKHELEIIVGLYAPAIPPTPKVSAGHIPMAVTLYPAEKEKPDLTGIDLTKHVAPELTVAPTEPRTSTLQYVIEGAIFFLLCGLLFAGRLRQKQRRQKSDR
jgi:ABC-type nitrate/sulfonate/bicarbonate transport system substrate-binding protein